MLVSKNFDPKCVGNFLKKKKKLCRAFLFENSVRFSCKDLGKFFLKNLSFLFLKIFAPKICWKSCGIFCLKILIFLPKFVFVKTCWAFLEWSCHVFWKFDKNLVGFSYEDFGKFSKKNLSVFENFLNLKLVENLVEFSFENFDILIKIGICENMLGTLGMILSCLLEIW